MELDKIKLKKSFNDAGDSFVGFGRKLRTEVDGLAEKGKEVWDRKSPEVRKACGDWQTGKLPASLNH